MRGTAGAQLVALLAMPYHRSLRLSLSLGGETPVSNQALARAEQMRRDIEDAEEQLQAETVHAKKFMWRGEGLRLDFERAKRPRRIALLRGAVDNEKALCRVLEEAEEAGLPQEYLEESIRVLNELAIQRAQIEREHARTEGLIQQ